MRDRGIDLRTLNGLAIDTTTPHGRLTFHVLAAVAEFERDMITERTQEGRRRAIAGGKRMGRAPKLTGEQEDVARRLLSSRMAVSDVARALGVHSTTLLRHGITARDADQGTRLRAPDVGRDPRIRMVPLAERPAPAAEETS